MTPRFIQALRVMTHVTATLFLWDHVAVESRIFSVTLGLSSPFASVSASKKITFLPFHFYSLSEKNCYRVPTSLEMSGRFPVFRKSLEMSGNVWKCLYFMMLEIFVSGNVWILTPVPLPNFLCGTWYLFFVFLSRTNSMTQSMVRLLIWWQA